MSAVNTKRRDLTEGALLPQVVLFILPLIATNLLQQCYHAADIMVAGLSSEPDAIGAVGSTGTFLALIRNLFLGFSAGANVVVARCIGQKDSERTARAVHTSLVLSLLLGFAGGIIGIALSRTVLVMMGYEGRLLTLGIRYAIIYLIGLPFLSLTQFLAAIFRAQGNTRTPLYVMSAAGLINVGLNLFFVLIIGLSVEGVAIATAAANALSAIVLGVILAKSGGDCRIVGARLRFYKAELADIVRIGLPASLQHSMFSISNMLIQSSILEVSNRLTPIGSEYAPVLKGNSAAGSLENFIFDALGTITVAASVFTAQNIGAGKLRRVKEAFYQILLSAVVIAVVMPAAGMLLRVPLLALYDVRADGGELAMLAFDTAMKRMFWKWPAFFAYAAMNTCAGTIRGMGRSALAAAITFFGTCAFRVIWVLTAFRAFGTLEVIYLSYPISWILTGACFFIVVRILWKREEAKL